MNALAAIYARRNNATVRTNLGTSPRDPFAQLPLPLNFEVNGFIDERLMASAIEALVEAQPPASAPNSDLRPEIAITLDAMGEYRFPKTARNGMIVELLSRKLYQDGDCHRPGWDIRMNFPWNRSGKIRGADESMEVCRDYDDMWSELIEEDPAIFHEACEKALEAWVDVDLDILDMDGEMACQLGLLEPGRDTLVISSFAGQQMNFASRAAWGDFVRSLEDDHLANLWTAFRVLDADLSRQQRAETMALEYNRIRRERESEWDLGVEGLSF